MSIMIRLLKDKPKDADGKGIWEIYGEDPNCDFGGYHHQPFLQVVNGTYEQACEYALTLPGFVTWGHGGDVKAPKHSKGVVDLDKLPQRHALEKKRADLMAEVAKIDKEIRKL